MARQGIGGFGIARIRTVFADKGYDVERLRELCHSSGVELRIHKRRWPQGRIGPAPLAGRTWNVRVWENRCLALRHDRLGFLTHLLPRSSRMFPIAVRPTRQF